MPDKDILEATQKAVILVKKQEAQRNRHFAYVMLVILSFGLFAQTLYLKSISDASKRSITAISQLSTNFAAQAERASVANQEILCNVQATGLGLAEGFAVWSKKFGVEIPPPPEGAQNIECDNGVDPVFIGDNEANIMHGTNDPDWMNGEGGNDTIYARGAGDTLVGDTGNDILYGGGGADTIFGGEGNDDLYSATNDGKADHLNGGEGQDTCYVRAKDTVTDCEKVIKR